MKVWVRNRQRRIRIRIREVTATATRILQSLGCLKAELSLLLVNDTQIQRLNRRYRGIDRPTDVLAFSMQEGENPPTASQMLGDVVISVGTAKRWAKSQGRPLELEVTVLLIHGILHLLGYHHEGSKEAARLVERKTRAVLEEIGRTET